LGYISRVAGILLWILGLIITSTVIYTVYWGAVPYVAPSAVWLLAVLLLLAAIAILAYWASVLSHGVSGR